jgi:hypothetical protein
MTLEREMELAISDVKNFFLAEKLVLTTDNISMQYALYVSMEGFKGDTWILDILSDEEYEQVMAIAEKMRKNAMVFSPAFKLL